MRWIFECHEFYKRMKASIVFIVDDFFFEFDDRRFKEKFGFLCIALDHFNDGVIFDKIFDVER